MAGATEADRRGAAEQLGRGTALHRNGQLGLAQGHYQRAVKLDPGNADGWHLLGVVALQAGNPQLAVKHLRQCVNVRPGFAEAHNNLGVALRRLDRHGESVLAFRTALDARERYVEAAGNLGLALISVGNDAAAEQVLRQCLEWRPDHADAATNLGNLLRRQGDLLAALPLLLRACAQRPDDAQGHGNLSLLFTDLGRHADAVVSARQAVALQPERAQWWCIAGIALRLRHDLDGAIEFLRKACELDPADQTSRFELALALQESGAIDESHSLLARVKPPAGTGERLRWMQALALPAIYRDEAEVDDARQRFEHGLLDLQQGLRLDTLGQRQEALQAVAGVSPFHLHYQPRDNTRLQHGFGDLLARVMGKVAPQCSEPCDWTARAHGGRIRVGVVSSQLMKHSVSRYFNALLASLDPHQFDVRIWYSGAERDASTDALASAVAHFEHVHDDALTTAAVIRASQLDVLIYPEIGMDPRHQTLAALRLAPVQCALYGHPVGSGLPTMDYFISGAAIEPVDAEHHYRERLVRLPGLGASPQPLPSRGDGGWLDGVPGNGPLLLCAQYHLKLVPAFDNMLASIVDATGARIGLFDRVPALGRRFRQRIDSVFRDRGLDPSCHLVDLPVQPYADYLAGLARSTLVLDSPWFSGGATSLDALGVGTPVLTLEGPMARGRQTAGMLRLLGATELIAGSDVDYIEKAIAFIGDATSRDATSERVRNAAPVLFNDQAAGLALAAFLTDPTTNAMP